MRALPFTSFAITFSAALCSTQSTAQPRNPVCAALSSLSNGQSDASGALADCLASTRAGGIVELPVGTYRLRQPIVISRSVTIRSAGSASAPCSADDRNCALLIVDPADLTRPREMPVSVVAPNVTLDRLIFKGVRERQRLAKLCESEILKANAGGIRVAGVPGFSLKRSVLRDFTCYTALEVHSGSNNLIIEDSLFGWNGDHRQPYGVADGVTIHDSVGAIVRRNRFFDNTDVQLVFGGCRNCVVTSNTFSHSGTALGSAFAELMLHSWPSTSGDFKGTKVTSNRIDCGSKRACGFGIQIGAEPWYEGRAFGGSVSANLVTNARIGMNVDGLTGPMDLAGNTISNAGGTFNSDCGRRAWSAINVAQNSKRFARGIPSGNQVGAASTKGCMLARDPL